MGCVVCRSSHGAYYPKVGRGATRNGRLRQQGRSTGINSVCRSSFLKLNPTAKDRTTCCSCINSEIFWLPVARFVKKSKYRNKTGLDRLQLVFRPVMCWQLGPYSRTYLRNCWFWNPKKPSRIGWDMAKSFLHATQMYLPSLFAISQPSLDEIA